MKMIQTFQIHTHWIWKKGNSKQGEQKKNKMGLKEKKSETKSEDWSIFEEFDSYVNKKNRNWGL